MPEGILRLIPQPAGDAREADEEHRPEDDVHADNRGPKVLNKRATLTYIFF